MAGGCCLRVVLRTWANQTYQEAGKEGDHEP